MYLYTVSAVKSGRCEPVAVLAPTYEAVVAELMAAGYDVPGPQDVEVMQEMKVIIANKEIDARGPNTIRRWRMRPFVKTV